MPKLPKLPNLEDALNFIDKAGDAVSKGVELIDRTTKKIDRLAGRIDSVGSTTIETSASGEQTATAVKTGTACLPCVPPEAIILTNPNAKTIRKLESGDKVLDIDGRYSVVTATMQRPYHGDMIVATVPYQNEPVKVTSEHQVLAVELHRCKIDHQTLCLPGKDNPRCSKCQLGYHYQPLFFPASELSTVGTRSHWVKHALLMPRLRDTADIQKIDVGENVNIGYEEAQEGWIKPRKGNAHNRSRNAIAVRRFIEVNKDLLKLIGFYLAEGSVIFLKRGAILRFDFGKDEADYVQETTELIDRVFGVKARTRTRTQATLTVEVCSSILGHFFANLLGNGALNKVIPPWLLTLPVNKQIGLLEGFWCGDGYARQPKRNPNTVNLQASTVSSQLAYSLRIMLHRLGIIHSLNKRKMRISSIDGRRIIGNGFIYSLEINGPSAIKLADMMGHRLPQWRFLQSHLAGIDDNWVYLPIKKIERVPYQGMVYNLETEPSNTYTVNGVVVHNCSRDHLSTTSSALSEAVRFARDKGVNDPEVLRRIRIALDEMNIMERIDLAPDEVSKLRGPEKELAQWTLLQSRNLRHAITDVKNVETLEQAAARASQSTEEFMQRMWAIPEEKCETCAEVRESLRQFIKTKGSTTG